MLINQKEGVRSGCWLWNYLSYRGRTLWIHCWWGRKKKGRLEKLLMGSVAERVIVLSPCPVLVVKAKNKIWRMRKNNYLLLTNYCLENKGNHRPLRVIGENLRAFRDRTHPAFYINLYNNLSFFSGLQTAWTSHHRCASSWWNQIFYDKLFIPGIRKIKGVFDHIAFCHCPKVIVSYIKYYWRLGVRDRREEQ